MGDADLIVAVVALVISVIVGIAIMSQLLAQIFSTAEGQRKCSSSLLGLWSRDPTTRTRRKWRWSELRYETKFVTPEICLGNSASPIPYEPDDAPDKTGSQIRTRFRSAPRTKKSSKRKTESVLGADFGLDYVLFISAFADDAPDMVSWLSFLTFVRLDTSDAKTQTLPDKPSRVNNTMMLPLGKAPEIRIVPLELSWPRIKYRVHSWDFMPPNAPKPFAKSTVHDIAVLVRRTGMVWKTFDPKNGNMSAEGGGHILTGTLVQGMGLILEYRCLDDNRLAGGVSKEISAILKHPEDTFTQSQKAALSKASANTPGLDQTHAHKDDEESPRSRDPDAEQDEWERKSQRVELWVKAMDKFMFGLIPVDPRLGLPDFPFAEPSDCVDVLVMLSEGNANIRNQLVKDTNQQWAFNDLIYMTPPVLETTLLFKDWAECGSIFSMASSCVAFGALLRAYLNGGAKIHESPLDEVKHRYPKLTDEKLWMKLLGEKKLLKGRQDGGTDEMKRVLAGVETMARKYEDSRKYEDQTIGKRLFRETMRDHHDYTTQYFSENKVKIRLHDLLKAHFSKAPLARSEAQRTEEEDEDLKFVLDDRGVPCYLIMEMYFSYIPDYVTFMREKHPRTSGGEKFKEDLVIEAWLMLMWRGILFCHLQDIKGGYEGIYVPHEYYGSRLPVFLV